MTLTERGTHGRPAGGVASFSHPPRSRPRRPRSPWPARGGPGGSARARPGRGRPTGAGELGRGGLELGRLAQQAGPGVGRSGDQVSTPGAPGRAGTGPLRARQGGSVITHRSVRAQARLELARPGGGSARAGRAGPGGRGGTTRSRCNARSKGGTTRRRTGQVRIAAIMSGTYPQRKRSARHDRAFRARSNQLARCSSSPRFPRVALGERADWDPRLAQLVPGWAVRLCQARGPSSVP